MATSQIFINVKIKITSKSKEEIMKNLGFSQAEIASVNEFVNVKIKTDKNVKVKS